MNTEEEVKVKLLHRLEKKASKHILEPNIKSEIKLTNITTKISKMHSRSV